MTRSDSHKVIARGYLPPQKHYKGQTVDRTFAVSNPNYRQALSNRETLTIGPLQLSLYFAPFGGGAEVVPGKPRLCGENLL